MAFCCSAATVESANMGRSERFGRRFLARARIYKRARSSDPPPTDESASLCWHPLLPYTLCPRVILSLLRPRATHPTSSRSTGRGGLYQTSPAAPPARTPHNHRHIIPAAQSATARRPPPAPNMNVDTTARSRAAASSCMRVVVHRLRHSCGRQIRSQTWPRHVDGGRKRPPARHTAP